MAKRIKITADWKTSNYFGSEMRYQLGGYYGCTSVYDKQLAQSLPHQESDLGVAVRVAPEGVDVRLMLEKDDLKRAYAHFIHALSLFRDLKDYGDVLQEERYQINGTAYVSVTHILRHVIAKPGLLSWYAKMAKDGKDPAAFRDERANYGTRIHKMLAMFFLGKSVDMGEAPEDLQKVMRNVERFASKYHLEPDRVECQLYHPDEGYAGTVDWEGTADESILEYVGIIAERRKKYAHRQQASG